MTSIRNECINIGAIVILVGASVYPAVSLALAEYGPFFKQERTYKPRQTVSQPIEQIQPIKTPTNYDTQFQNNQKPRRSRSIIGELEKAFAIPQEARR